MSKSDPTDPFTRDPSKPGAGARPSPAAPPAQPLQPASPSSPAPTSSVALPPPPPGSVPLGQAPNSATSKNWMGITSLITGVIGASLLAVIFGILGLNAAKRGEADNRAMSIAGLAVTGAWLVFGGLFVAFAVITEVNTPGTSKSYEHVAVGECFLPNGVVADDGETFEVRSFRVINCAEPHYGQVYLIDELMGSSIYPGEVEIYTDVEDICFTQYDEVIADAGYLKASYISYIYPSRELWNVGDREFMCLAVAASPDDLYVGNVLLP